MKKMRRRFIQRFILGSLAIAATCCVTCRAHAINRYWDTITSGTASGAGDTPSGTWGVNSDWNTSATGGTAGTFTATTGSSDNLYFVANPSASSGENAYTITVTGTQIASRLIFQSAGAPSFLGSGAINLWCSGGGTAISLSQPIYGSTPQGAVTISVPINLQGRNLDQQF